MTGTLSTRFAASACEREAIFRLRYQVYVEEMGRPQKDADHAARRIEDRLDARAHVVGAWRDNVLVGTVRANLLADGDVGPYRELYGLDLLSPRETQRTSVTTRMMVLPSVRRGRVAQELAVALYSFALSRGLQYDYIDCNAHLIAFFEHLGYVRHRAARHPEYGQVMVMRLDLTNGDYLERVGSPFARRLRAAARESTIDVYQHLQIETGRRALSRATSEIVSELKAGIDDLLGEVRRLPAWQAVTSETTPKEVTRAIMREVYREIASYQPDVIEATIAVIGQFPRSLPAKKVRAMLIHQAEEWDHGEMALRDAIGLGDNEAALRAMPMTPTAFTTAAFWRMLAHRRMPFAYLGALYLFEGLTPIVTGLVKQQLVNQGFSSDNLEYVEFHSTEDIRHAKLIDALITDVVAQYPERADEVRFGFETFRRIYPMPGWNAAYERAMTSLGANRAGAA